MLRFGYKSTNLPHLSTGTKHVYKEERTPECWETHTKVPQKPLKNCLQMNAWSVRAFLCNAFSLFPNYPGRSKFYYQEQTQKKAPPEIHTATWTESALPSYHRPQAKALTVLTGAESLHKDGDRVQSDFSENNMALLWLWSTFTATRAFRHWLGLKRSCLHHCLMPVATTEDKRWPVENGCGIICTTSKSCQSGSSLMVWTMQV